MSKQQLSAKKQLAKLLGEAEAGSALHRELTAVQASLEKPAAQAVPELISLLKSAKEQEARCLIAVALGVSKDPRVIQPLLQAAAEDEDSGYFLRPLEKEKYDCTEHLEPLVDLMLAHEYPNETLLLCDQLVHAMQGPFPADTVKGSIKKLLDADSTELGPAMSVTLDWHRIGTAQYLLQQYFYRQVCTEHDNILDGPENIEAFI